MIGDVGLSLLLEVRLIILFASYLDVEAKEVIVVWESDAGVLVKHRCLACACAIVPPKHGKGNICSYMKCDRIMCETLVTLMKLNEVPLGRK